MKKITCHHGKIRVAAAKVAIWAVIICPFFFPHYPLSADADADAPPVATAELAYDIILNGKKIGTAAGTMGLEDLLCEARRQISATSDELLLAAGEISYLERTVTPGEALSHRNDILTGMVNVLRGDVRQTLHRSYTVKINNFVANLASKDEVVRLLQAVIDKYDTEGLYEVRLAPDGGRELSVLTAHVEKRTDPLAEYRAQLMVPAAGIEQVAADLFASVTPTVEKTFADYDNGLIAIFFEDTVAVVEAYLPADELIPIEEAIAEITKEEDKPRVYEIVSGDTLSGISLTLGVPIDTIVELNDSLESENTTIRIGEELIYMVPEPELVVVRLEERFIEEYYNEAIVYIPIDDWYTTQSRTIQEPSAGVRKIAAITTYHNHNAVAREILLEEILYQGIPKIVERGTKIPPTYRKPLSGGRMSSGFGSRTAPIRGASTYHRGVDWATPTGTAIFASSGGVVAKAGWGSGYGYVVYIDHPDGRQTRYGHLSRVLVRTGQAVSQGEKIALSGNTGISSGPHLHFEILINGRQVNPLRYLN